MIEGYRWWTVYGWWNERECGLKCGPLTVAWFKAQRCGYVSVLGRPIYDGIMRQLKRDGLA